MTLTQIPLHQDIAACHLLIYNQIVHRVQQSKSKKQKQNKQTNNTNYILLYFDFYQDIICYQKQSSTKMYILVLIDLVNLSH